MNVKVYKRKKLKKLLEAYAEKYSKKNKSEENRRLWNKVLKSRVKENNKI